MVCVMTSTPVTTYQKTHTHTHSATHKHIQGRATKPRTHTFTQKHTHPHPPTHTPTHKLPPLTHQHMKFRAFHARIYKTWRTYWAHKLWECNVYVSACIPWTLQTCAAGPQPCVWMEKRTKSCVSHMWEAQILHQSLNMVKTQCSCASLTADRA